MHYIFCNSYPVQILFFQISFWGGAYPATEGDLERFQPVTERDDLELSNAMSFYTGTRWGTQTQDLLSVGGAALTAPLSCQTKSLRFFSGFYFFHLPKTN